MLHSIRQFIEALQDPYGLTRTLGEIEVCRSSDGEPLRWVGNSAVVFKIRCGSRYKMLKCYTRPMEHLEAIYQEKLLRQELYVWQADGQGEWCDVVVDDWIEGITLYEAVMRGAGSGDKAHLSNLARQFDRLALELLESDWAHGDLKPENILLDEAEMENVVEQNEAEGTGRHLYATVKEKNFAAGQLRVLLALSDGTELTASRFGMNANIQPGQQIKWYFDPRNAIVVDREFKTKEPADMSGGNQ